MGGTCRESTAGEQCGDSLGGGKRRRGGRHDDLRVGTPQRLKVFAGSARRQKAWQTASQLAEWAAHMVLAKTPQVRRTLDLAVAGVPCGMLSLAQAQVAFRLWSEVNEKVSLG
eukprot:2639584-Amphidinium_carterae.1